MAQGQSGGIECLKDDDVVGQCARLPNMNAVVTTHTRPQYSRGDSRVRAFSLCATIQSARGEILYVFQS